MRVCKAKGCRKLTDNINGYCDEHQDQWKRKRSRHTVGKGGKYRATNPFYWSEVWRATRRTQIDIEPLCRRCDVLGQEVDHIVPIEQGGAPLEFDNLQTLCSKCHRIKSAEDRAKYGLNG